jgi:hypothetical protein
MKLDLNHPWPKLLLAAVVLIAPSTLSYCKAREEAQTQNAHARREADAGYKTLVNSVEKLERIVAAQQDTLKLLTERAVLMMPPDAGSASVGEPHVNLPAAPDVSFAPLPDTTAQALREADAI